MATTVVDKEIQQYRDLVQIPDRLEEGFGWKMVVAALFLGFLMVPGSIYMALFMGAGLGPAAQWVTVILFAEVTRRSMKGLKQQEIYLLFYMTGIALGGGLSGGVFSGLLWNQYLVRSPAAKGMGISPEIPWWVAPPASEIEAAGRTFFTSAWLGPILFIVGMMIISRIDNFGLGYALYRLTAHVEKLPFPMAPVGALGITALAEANAPGQRWRWRCFSLGGVLGMIFGFVYVGIPALTGVFLGSPVEIIPIPWLDLTPAVSRESFLPAVPLNIVFDLGEIIVGMVLPFWAVIGGFVALLITWILTPLLRLNGYLPHWQPGMGVVDTLFNNTIDFYLSFGIGISLAIFAVSVFPLVRGLFNRFGAAAGGARGPRPEGSFLKRLTERSKERGDISILVSLCIYVCSSILYIVICCWLMPGTPERHYADRFPWPFFLGFAFIYRPIIGYINAKLEGMVGQNVSIPLIEQAAYILSGYKGAKIWFAPVPIGDASGAVRGFRVMELVGARLTGVIKIELLAIPILAVTSLLFSELIWRLAPIPSEIYPFTQEIWDLNARNTALTITSTMEGSSPFMEALKPGVIGAGFSAGVVSFMLLSFLRLPVFLVYGAVRGFNQVTPGALLFELIGALVGRFYLQKKYGHKMFKQYVMIILAGFSAGVGLIGMGAVAIALIVKSTSTLGY